MINIIISDKKNTVLKKLINDFLEKSNFSSDENVYILCNSADNFEKGHSVYVVPYGYETQEKSKCYSLSNNKADVVLINIQNHPETKSFEIMTDTSMGRVFINNKNNISVENVLMCASAFYALGMNLNDILVVLNSILK